MHQRLFDLALRNLRIKDCVNAPDRMHQRCSIALCRKQSHKMWVVSWLYAGFELCDL